MNTIFNHPDIDSYLLYFLDIKTIVHMAILSKNQYSLLQENLSELFLAQNNNIKYIINYAAENNCIRLLRWVHDSVHKFLYSNITINVAALNGNCEVLDWLYCNYKIYTITNNFCAERIFSNAARKNHMCVLQWCHEHGFKSDNIHPVVYEACRNENLNILNWIWANYKITWIPEDCIDCASSLGFVSVLEWFKQCKLELKYTENAIDKAAANGFIEVLQWYHNNGYSLKYSKNAIDFACKYGHLDIIIWFDKNGYELKYSKSAITHACKYNHLEIIKWFYNSAYKIKYNEWAIIHAIAEENDDIIEWFETHNFNFIIVDKGSYFGEGIYDWKNKDDYEQIKDMSRNYFDLNYFPLDYERPDNHLDTIKQKFKYKKNCIDDNYMEISDIIIGAF